MSVSKDLTKRYDDFSAELLDEDFGFYELQPNGNAYVYVEKFVIKKDKYVRTNVGSTKRSRPNCRLIKEDSFTDIGGGYFTFLRHYARRPDPWFDFQQKSALLYNNTTNTRRGINYDYFFDKLPYGFDATFGAFRRDFTFNAKATRYYIDRLQLDSYVSTSFDPFGFGWEYNPVYPDGIDDNLIIPFDGYDYPAKLFVHQPRAKVFLDDDTEAVIAPDIIKHWAGDYYEVTRFTSSINVRQPSRSANVPINAYFTLDDSFTDDEKTFFATYVNAGFFNLTFRIFDAATNQNITSPVNVSIDSITNFIANIVGDSRFETIGVEFTLPSTAFNNIQLEIAGLTEFGTNDSTASTLIGQKGKDDGAFRFTFKWDKFRSSITIRLSLSKFTG